MDIGIAGKTALVTGGANGIGEATVRLLAAEGARVAIVDRNRSSGEELAEELGDSALFVEADLCAENACRDSVERVVREFGDVNILVNNAGVNDGISLGRPPKDFMGSLQLNLFHVYAMTHFSMPHLLATRGCVVNVSSKVAVTGQGGTSGYAAAKGAVNALTREWAVACAKDGVRVNCVVPAECDTPQYENWFKTLSDPAATKEAIERLVPLEGRMTKKEEIAAMIVFLASPLSGHTTGQITFVDGGYTHLDRAVSHGHTKWDA